MGKATVRIGCASGFWGDSEAAAEQLVRRGNIDYLVFDFLAEITMSLLARAKAKNPDSGYAADFVRILGPLAGEIRDRGIRVVSNAGGINPHACRDALQRELDARGVSLRIAVVEGDDLSGQAEALRERGVREMFSGEPLPVRLQSVNAYLGARPIAVALDAGADVVITGRCVDSAVTLGPLVHEFGWQWSDWDRLAMGSLGGHIIECGAQATGGLFTDWESVPGWDDMGFPIVEFDAAAESFLVTKPEGTGGLLTPATVAEQILYEIADPKAYLLPDVTCDFSFVQLIQEGADRVRVSGARGGPAPSSYKVSATWSDGWRLMSTLMIGGIGAARKAERVAEAILARTRRLFAERGWSDYRETSIEVLGAESTYGPHARVRDPREVILKIAARHDSRDALELLSREIAPSATAMAQGITGFAGGRATPSPVVRLFSFLVDRQEVSPAVDLDGACIPVPDDLPGGVASERGEAASAPDVVRRRTGATQTVPLIRIAHGRSGDKGDTANIGIVARSPALYPVLLDVLTERVVAEYFAHVANGPVRRYALPGLHALNFTLERALGGGGIASLRYDPQGKAYAQMLMDLPVSVPTELLQDEV